MYEAKTGKGWYKSTPLQFDHCEDLFIVINLNETMIGVGLIPRVWLIRYIKLKPWHALTCFIKHLALMLYVLKWKSQHVTTSNSGCFRYLRNPTCKYKVRLNNFNENSSSKPVISKCRKLKKHVKKNVYIYIWRMFYVMYFANTTYYSSQIKSHNVFRK